MTELAEIIRLHGAEYLAKHDERMLPSHRKAMRDIGLCRTPPMGGRVYTCRNNSDHHDYSYHSCKNRACPKCQNNDATEWIRQQEALLLNTDYFLVTTTVPHQLHPVARSNQKTVYGKLISSSAQAIVKLIADKKYCGGLGGCIGVLQTWDRTMGYHLHVHFIVPAGAFSKDLQRWRPVRNKQYLIPEKALAKLVRGKFKDAMRKEGLFSKINPKVWTKNWIADCEYVGSAHSAIKYIAPYVHRIAITNRRIEKLHQGEVTFRYKVSRSTCWKRMTLPVDTFLARFLQHVLPKGFQKVRYYGIFHHASRDKLNAARQSLGQAPYSRPARAARPPETGYRPCPICGAEMTLTETIKPKKSRAPPWK